MNSIDKYQQTQRECRDFERWKSLIGKEYFGGTRGRGGEYGSVVNARFFCEIYHQESDGATNYHGSGRLGEIANNALNEAAKKHSASIIATAMDIMLERLSKAAADASSLAQAIANDAQKAKP
jgi:hypothetical protein